MSKGERIFIRIISLYIQEQIIPSLAVEIFLQGAMVSRKKAKKEVLFHY